MFTLVALADVHINKSGTHCWNPKRQMTTYLEFT